MNEYGKLWRFVKTIYIFLCFWLSYCCKRVIFVIVHTHICTLAFIYYQIPKPDSSQTKMILEIWMRMENYVEMWIRFTYSSFFCSVAITRDFFFILHTHKFTLALIYNQIPIISQRKTNIVLEGKIKKEKYQNYLQILPF